MTSQDLPKPDLIRNMRLIGYSDQGGRPDGVQLMVSDGFAYVGHIFSEGFSIIDVRNPLSPTPVGYFEAPANTWNIHLQTHGDLLLVINAKDMFAASEFQDEREGCAWQEGWHSRQGHSARAGLDGRHDSL
jgi:hypothetical protein